MADWRAEEIAIEEAGKPEMMHLCDVNTEPHSLTFGGTIIIRDGEPPCLEIDNFKLAINFCPFCGEKLKL